MAEIIWGWDKTFPVAGVGSKCLDLSFLALRRPYMQGPTCLCVRASLSVILLSSTTGGCCLVLSVGPRGARMFSSVLQPWHQTWSDPSYLPRTEGRCQLFCPFSAIDCCSLVLSVRSRVPERFFQFSHSLSDFSSPHMLASHGAFPGSFASFQIQMITSSSLMKT